ncbi:hypothetical protein SAMN06265222_104104 [Neorhodopirellula lusitana]|uniref:Uncharacterized protein n=1 Tax=Neorhodopirellula lusitana TaxID=445327 RepID=A0ABY1PZ17_9BACT|nr:hypothetical protein [Neorhodopirellula lusitana]SMP53389.1 hypothetical protein SAMN06265222_104104 [Neorhodopirellula lusitana]
MNPTLDTASESPGSNAGKFVLNFAWAALPKPTQYGLLVFATLCQAVTVWITWPLWLARTVPPNLPTIDLPPFSFGWLIVGSLVLVCCVPRQGLLLHWAVLLVASFFDQFRLQPQFYAIALLMAACVWDRARVCARWLLAAMWLWAGLHKAVSPDWFGHGLAWLTARTDWNGYFSTQVLGWGIAVVEMVVGVLACFRPRWAAVPCVLMHVGIVVTLSPLMVNWNESVIPWNLATAVVGGWIMWQSNSWKPSEFWMPQRRSETVFAAACFIAPLGFYVGWVDHGFANVLYSGCIPNGLITTRDGVHKIRGWSDLAVPFPNERRTLEIYFEQYAAPGDKLHVSDPRPLLDDAYFVLGEDRRAIEIDADSFFSMDAIGKNDARVRNGDPALARPGDLRGVAGIGLDTPRAIFAFKNAGVRMLRPALDQPVNALAFTPENFDPALLVHLHGLPNLSQVQLAGTSVQDSDLRWLAGLRLLSGLGLDQTSITDAGLVHLEGMPYLQYIEHEGTAITPGALKRILREPF